MKKPSLIRRGLLQFLLDWFYSDSIQKTSLLDLHPIAIDSIVFVELIRHQ